MRTLLTAALTLYVNQTTGNDANDGLTPATAWQDANVAIQRAVDSYDLGGFWITIQNASGQVVTTGVKLLNGSVGRGGIAFDGGGSTFLPTNDHGFANYGGGSSFFAIQNVKVGTLVSGYAILNQVPGYMYIGPGVEIVGAAQGGIVATGPGSYTQIGATGFTLSGDCPKVLFAACLGQIVGTDVTTWVTCAIVPGSSPARWPTVSDAFAVSTALGLIQPLNFNYLGTVVGKKHRGNQNGGFNTGGQDFPGTAGGTVSGGAWFS